MGCNCGYAIGHPLVPSCTCKKRKQREWKGLTAKERSELWWSTDMSGMPEHDYGKKIEALLKEKNCG
jgi:hypothetical protein